MCLIISKIGFVVLGYMSANTEGSKFKYISDKASDCTHNDVFLFELKQIALVLPKISSCMIIYILFIVAIILVNAVYLCKKCYHLLSTSPYIGDSMHEGEYSHVGMGFENDTNPTTGLENQTP